VIDRQFDWRDQSGRLSAAAHADRRQGCRSIDASLEDANHQDKISFTLLAILPARQGGVDATIFCGRTAVDNTGLTITAAASSCATATLFVAKTLSQIMDASERAMNRLRAEFVLTAIAEAWGISKQAVSRWRRVPSDHVTAVLT
jgi:hypothetical protein